MNHQPTRLCIAAPDVDKKEPMMTTQGVGHASWAIINPPPMLSPNLQQYQTFNQKNTSSIKFMVGYDMPTSTCTLSVNFNTFARIPIS